MFDASSCHITCHGARLLPPDDPLPQSASRRLGLRLRLVGDVAFNLLTVDRVTADGVGAGTFVVSLLTSIASVGIGPVGSPSLVGETDRH